jgi:endonuclease III
VTAAGDRRSPLRVGGDGPAIVAALARFYGPLPTPPDDPFRCHVWEVLATQTTPGRRDAALAALQRLRALTPDAMWRVPRQPLEAAVRLAGAHVEQRMSALGLAVEQFRREPRLSEAIRGPLRQARRAAAGWSAAGAGSVHRLLLFAGGHCVQPVDPDVVRLWRRLTGVTPGVALHPRQARREIEAALPREIGPFRRAAVYLRHHATQTCTPVPHCSVCPLRMRCPGAPRWLS